MNAKFLELVPQLPEMGFKKFRSEVTFAVKEAFGITQNAVSTHFNHAKKKYEAANGGIHIGRAPEKNNGGRKKKSTEVAEAVATLLGTTPEAAAETAAAETPAADAAATEPAAAVVLFTVTKVSDGTVVAAGVDQATADALVAKAASAKKAKLQYAEVVA